MSEGIERFYDYKQIADAGDCRRFVTEILKLNIEGDRCAATWRGGTNPASISLKKDQWFDHSRKVGGGLLELCAYSVYGSHDDAMSLQKAQQKLGDWLNLTVSMTKSLGPQISRYDRLVAEGWNEVARYDYNDPSGAVVHFTCRMHRGDEKTFLQGHMDGDQVRWGLHGIEPILYNLAGFNSSPWICIVEGEKDADNLIEIGLPATTNAMGAEKWNESYNQYFKGKDVVIFRDNDDAGEKHGFLIARHLVGSAKAIKIITPSTIPGGDVSDYLETNSPADLTALITSAPLLAAADIPSEKDETTESDLETAKESNKSPFRNFNSKNVKKGDKVFVEKEPRQMISLVQDVHRRFLGFPRKINDGLFDHDRETGRIVAIRSQKSLFAWIQLKSGQNVDWTRGDTMVTKDELFEGVKAQATLYEAIGHVPDYPLRDDVYYAHEKLPKPDPKHKYFNEFVDFFNFENDIYQTIAKAFITAPIFYVRSIPRPSWIIDSNDGPQVGKTTFAETVAYLYGHAPIHVQVYQLRRDISEVIKRLVSTEGRNARVFLMDNVTGIFRSEELSGLITRADITGKAPYGHGEESRPNNLTYVITANNASVDNDIAIRSFYIFMKRSQFSATWKGEMMKYIETNRYHIFADIVDILENHTPFDLKPCTRFPEFETQILQAFCKDTGEFDEVIKTIKQDTQNSNSDEEMARQIEDVFRGAMVELGIHPDNHCVFIHSAVAENWLKRALPNETKIGVGIIRTFAQAGLFPIVDKKINIWPSHGKDRRRGIMWNKQIEGRRINIQSIISLDRFGKPKLIEIGPL